MSSDLRECEARAPKLAPRERAALAERLISSLDTLDDAESERFWLEEAERRYEEYKNGGITARSADDVLRDAQTMIR